MPTTPQFNSSRLAADADLGVGTLMAVLLSGVGGAATLKFYDATSAAGDSVIEFAVLNGESKLFRLDDLGGLKFSTGMFADIGGTSAFARIWKQ